MTCETPPATATRTATRPTSPATRCGRVLMVSTAVVLLAGALAGCQHTPPMLQPVAPVPTITEG